MKYSVQIAWRSLASMVFQLTRETVLDPATYRVYVSAIDTNNPGAGDTEIGYWVIDYWGVPYLIIGTGSGYVDVQDYFRVGRCPTSGMNCVVYKSVYNGRAVALFPDSFQHLHLLALANSQRYSMAILWANDPNAKKVPFTAQSSPSIINYQDDQVDPEDSVKTLNYASDFGETPSVRLIKTDGVLKYHIMQNCFFTFDTGLIDTIYFDIGEPISGYILISRA